jgi:hypothetical protein
VIASDGTSGSDRYLSRTYLGAEHGRDGRLWPTRLSHGKPCVRSA